MRPSRKIENFQNVWAHSIQRQLLTLLSMQYKVVNQQALLQSNLDHRNSMANHSGVDHCSPSQCRVRQQPYAKTTLHKIRNIYTMYKNSPHAYKLIPLDVVIILKTLQCSYLCTFLSFCLVYFVCHNFCLSCYVVCNLTMAEANGIRDLPKQDIQSILEGFSIDDSERSLPQVPNETLGLSSVSQT